MKRTSYLCFVIAGFCSAASLFASGYEIKTSMNSTETGNTDVTVFLQENNLRADLPGTSMLVNLLTGDITTVMHEQKMFMQLPMGGMPGFSNIPAAEDEIEPIEASTKTSENAEATLQPTGRKESISGFPCEEYIIPTEPGLTIWFTKESPMQSGFLNRLTGLAGVRRNIPAGFAALSDLPGFPVRVTSARPGEEFEMTILSVREKSFAASDFAPPAGYQPFSLPPEFGDMLKQLQEQNNP